MNKIAFTIFTALSSIAMAHSDIRPRVEMSKIVTDGFSDADGTTQTNLHVFGFDFAENPDDPFFVQDPGFNAPTGSGLPVSSQLAFNLPGVLLYWNGTGDASFSPVATGESLVLNFGASTRTITGASAAQSGFNIQTIGAGGAVHRHLSAFLNGPDGNAVPAAPGSWGTGDGIQPADGIYLFSMELFVTPAGGVAGSDPIYVVFKNGLDEASHDLAMEWVSANLVPEPGSALLLAAPVMLLMRRRSSHTDTPQCTQ